jgi:hypothetical protein
VCGKEGEGERGEERTLVKRGKEESCAERRESSFCLLSKEIEKKEEKETRRTPFFLVALFSPAREINSVYRRAFLPTTTCCRSNGTLSRMTTDRCLNIPGNNSLLSIRQQYVVETTDCCH